MKLYTFLSLLPIFHVCQSKVIMIGDSLLASNTPIENILSNQFNVSISNKALIGASIGDGWILNIPMQYTLNKNKEFTNIIMDGGGNDVLSNQNECREFTNKCKNKIDEITEKLEFLFEKMNNDGVKNLIYLGFYYIKNLNKAIDYGSTQIIEICSRSQLNCYFCDARNLSFSLSYDGVHPTNDGYQKLAELIINTIKNNSITLNS